MEIRVISLDTDELVTEIARLLAYTRTMADADDRKAIATAAANLSRMFNLDRDRVLAKAEEICTVARTMAEQSQSARWN